MSSNLSVQAFTLLNMKTLADRLKLALTQAGMKQIDLARGIGITRGAVSLWFNGTTTSLESENLLKAAQILGVSANWLASGRGRMKSPSATGISLMDNPDYPAIKRVNITITESGGFDIEPLVGDYAPLVFPRAWFEQHGYDPEKLLAIEIRGPEMESSLYAGDWVVANTADTAPKEGVAFAVGMDGDAVVRRLFRSDGQWAAASDNPDKRLYRDRPISGDAFIIGRIVHKQSERI
jgi:phage repressor protein C with HTH and peptisase S24 domain